MKTTKTLMIFAVSLLGLTSCANSQSNDSNGQNWQTYLNDEYGFSFEYPSSWKLNGNEVESINLSGKVTSVQVLLRDTVSNIRFSLEYHLAPNGRKIYQYALLQFKAAQGQYATDAKWVEVAGSKGIEGISIRKLDGKGYELNPAIRVIKVDFLDKNGTGEFQLQFEVPTSSNLKSLDQFNHLLSSFQLI